VQAIIGLPDCFRFQARHPPEDGRSCPRCAALSGRNFGIFGACGGKAGNLGNRRILDDCGMDSASQLPI
jgi:hypothetical protein